LLVAIFVLFSKDKNRTRKRNCLRFFFKKKGKHITILQYLDAFLFGFENFNNWLLAIILCFSKFEIKNKSFFLKKKNNNDTK
jgi:hypothetical protein